MRIGVRQNISKLLVYMLAFVVAGAFSACSTNHSVTNGGLIQKRKYNKGYYFRLFEKKNTVDPFEDISRIDPSADLYIDPVEFPESSLEYFEPVECLFASAEEDEMMIVQNANSVMYYQKVYSEPVVEVRDISVKHRNRMLKKTSLQEEQIENETDSESGISIIWFVIFALIILFGGRRVIKVRKHK